jgi:diguanylate cyclase (GGDEF)-like protein
LIRQSRRERDRNPTTNLPGSQAIEETVTELLRLRRDFALLYIDIENFRSFADAYGYLKADEVIAHTGNLILQHVRAGTDPPAFVGHVGGDDFMVVSQSPGAMALAEAIKEAFIKTVDCFYTEEDRKRRYLSITDDRGEVRRANFMNPSIAVVEVSAGEYKSIEELASKVTLEKSKVRRRTSLDLPAVR